MAWGTLDPAIAVRALDAPQRAEDTGLSELARLDRELDRIDALDRVARVAGAVRPRAGAVSRAAKATVDAVGAAVLLVLVSPLLLLLMVAIRLDTPGPAIFRQVRVGKDGRLFEVLKLRTMVCDAEERKAELLEHNEYDGVLFKMRRDPRVTRVGGFLRRTSLDELPQLVNVLRGQMSLVGPRPSLPDEVALMDDDALRRFAVRPGITGLWQVSGRSNLGWDEAKALDTHYADNWTVVGDVAILLRTVKAVVSADGAC